MKSVLKVSLAALTLAFAVSSHAADKKLVVATDTAFVPFEFKQWKMVVPASVSRIRPVMWR